MTDLDKAISIGHVALKAIEVIEAAARVFTNAMKASKEQLSSALDEMKEMRDTLKSDREKTDSRVDKEFK